MLIYDVSQNFLILSIPASLPLTLNLQVTINPPPSSDADWVAHVGAPQWGQLEWLLTRAVDLGLLRAQRASFTLRPSSLGAVLQHIVEEGGPAAA